MWKLFLMLLLFLFLVSCNRIERQHFINIVSEWENRQIKYPSNMLLTSIDGDSIVFDGTKCKYTIVSYLDSIGCLSCRLKLSDWDLFVKQLNVEMQSSVCVLFVIHTKRKKDVNYIIKKALFKYPVFFDKKDSFNILNHFPLDESFRSFLLDENNKVIAIGNPIHNPKVRELYLQIIKGERVELEDASKVVRTTVDIDRTYALLGNFDWQKEQNVSFVLKNTGKQPLVIEYVKTSCGCTSVDYSKEPVQPGKEIQLNVTYKAEHPEHFNKTITVYCNTETSPITLKISGDAK